MFNPQPEDCTCFRFPVQCICLKLNGAWPLNSIKDDNKYLQKKAFACCYIIWAWLVIFCVVATFFFQVAFLFENLDNILVATETCCTTLMGALNSVRLLHLRLKKRKFKALIEQFVNDVWIRENSYPDIETACKKRMKLFLIMPVLLCLLIVSYVTVPLVKLATSGWQSNAKTFPYRMSFPYDAYQGWSYVFTYIFTSFGGIFVVTTLFAEDTLFAFFVTHTCGQYSVLHRLIDELIPRSVENVGSQSGEQKLPDHCYQQEYKRQLNALAEMHQKLIVFADNLENFMSPILFVNFITSSLLICVVVFQLVTGRDIFIGDFIKFMVYILHLMSQLYTLCWNGDLLIQHSSDTATHLYSCNWQSPVIHEDVLQREGGNAQGAYVGKACPPDSDFRMRLMLMIMRSQKPSKITALKFSDLSLKTFTTILSTSMSYFTLVQAIYGKRK